MEAAGAAAVVLLSLFEEQLTLSQAQLNDLLGQADELGRDEAPRVADDATVVVGKTFGVRRVPVVKDQAMPAYDPRAVKGIGVTYATTPMGADHTAGYATGANILGVGGSVDPLKPEGQYELSQGLQIATASLWSLDPTPQLSPSNTPDDAPPLRVKNPWRNGCSAGDVMNSSVMSRIRATAGHRVARSPGRERGSPFPAGGSSGDVRRCAG